MTKKIKKTPKKIARNKKNRSVFDVSLDTDEQELVDSVERDEWKPVDNFEQHKITAEAAASNYFRKEARVTFRISKHDLLVLKEKAAKKGLTYQTFIASILHQFAAGDLEERAA